jgi:hypothetical protein
MLLQTIREREVAVLDRGGGYVAVEWAGIAMVAVYVSPSPSPSPRWRLKERNREMLRAAAIVSA